MFVWEGRKEKLEKLGEGGSLNTFADVYFSALTNRFLACRANLTSNSRVLAVIATSRSADEMLIFRSNVLFGHS